MCLRPFGWMRKSRALGFEICTFPIPYGVKEPFEKRIGEGMNVKKMAIAICHRG